MFERLTEFHGGIWGMSVQATKEGYDRYSVFSRLAAYEDSELSPEEVQELAKAEAEGRLVVLPCKVGDTVFFTRWSFKSGSREIYAKTVINVRYDSCDRTVMISDGEKYGMLDRDVFLTREAAEKALGGGEG